MQKKAGGIYGFSSNILQFVANEIISKMLKLQEFLKKFDKTKMKNYRSISLLSNIAKYKFTPESQTTLNEISCYHLMNTALDQQNLQEMQLLN